MEEKKCGRCKVIKPVESFNPDPNYKRGRRSWCISCSSLAGKLYKKNLKLLILGWYGSVCACCQEKELAFLTLDHVKDNGTRDCPRKNGARNCGWNWYRQIKHLGYEFRPLDLQVLCFNCQWGKRLHQGFCPHHPDVDLRLLNQFSL